MSVFFSGTALSTALLLREIRKKYFVGASDFVELISARRLRSALKSVKQLAKMKYTRGPVP